MRTAVAGALLQAAGFVGIGCFLSVYVGHLDWRQGLLISAAVYLLLSPLVGTAIDAPFIAVFGWRMPPQLRDFLRFLIALAGLYGIVVWQNDQVGWVLILFWAWFAVGAVWLGVRWIAGKLKSSNRN